MKDCKQGFQLPVVQMITQQLFEALGLLKRLNIVHARLLVAALPC